MAKPDQQHWLRQAERAEADAKAGPAADLDGFFASTRDAEEFRRLAVEASAPAPKGA